MKNAYPSAVYVIEADDAVKVGRSATVGVRLKALSQARGSLLRLIHVTEVRDDASFVEARAGDDPLATSKLWRV